MDYDFSNKVVLVTGAGAGIGGEATAVLLAKLGVQLALVDRDEQNLEAVAEKCRQEQGVDVLTILADLSTNEGCEKTAKMTLDHFGRLDVLMNNAGIGSIDLIETADMEVHLHHPSSHPYSIHQRMTGASDEECRHFFKSCEKNIPLGETCSSGDIAKMVVHLASDHSRLVTGADVYVDGGLQFCGLVNTLKDFVK